ncbi:MAG: hypothetical protein EOP11_09445 [Proteobacteria bacterium]|nr:MAG: hypothetical protein EOP11_09445 [Pseudomonadota bacterium]
MDAPQLVKLEGVSISLGEDGFLPIYLKGEALFIKTRELIGPAAWEAPFPSIYSLLWGSSRLLHVNYVEPDGQFKQLPISGTVPALEALALRIRAANPKITEDISGKRWTDFHTFRAAIAVMLVLGIPLFMFWLANYFG